MLGGILNPNCQTIVLTGSLQSGTLVIAAFGSALYAFDKATNQCLAQINLGHQTNIMAISYSYKDNLLVTIDKRGICKFSIPYFHEPGNYKSEILASSKILGSKKTGQTFDDIRGVLLSDNSFMCHYIQNSKLFRCQIQLKIKRGKKNMIESLQANLGSNNKIAADQQFTAFLMYRVQGEILLVSVLEISKKCLHIQQIEKGKSKEWEFTHSIEITAAEIHHKDRSLIIGDAKGKIYVLNGYFIGQKYTVTKLEWHTTSVSSLCLNGYYLYSGGEESVVVLWHIQDYSRDFLPRIGTPIKSLRINHETNEITCCLSNNSIKIIDIGQDKETYTFQLLLNPYGYYRNKTFEQNPIECQYRQTKSEAILSLNSIAGRLQFMDLKSCRNSQFEVIQRNLISKLDSETPEPHEISSYCFLEDNWNDMLVSVSGSHNQNCLKFYRKKIGTDFQYQLLTKVDHPHKGQVKKCFRLGNGKYLTYSLQDQQIKIWSQKKQKKKSIIQCDITYWRCERVISHRGLAPRAVSCLENGICVVYKNQILMTIVSDSSFQDSGKAFEEKSENSIKDIFLLTNDTYSLIREDETIQIWKWNKKQPNLIVALSHQSLKSSRVFLGKSKTAFLIQSELQTVRENHILIYDHPSQKFTKSSKCASTNNQPFNVIGAFWYNELNNNLVLILDSLVMYSLIKQEFVQFAHMGHKHNNSMQEQTKEYNKFGASDPMEIFHINSRWVNKNNAISKNSLNKNMGGVQTMPSCDAALSTVLQDMLF